MPEEVKNKCKKIIDRQDKKKKEEAIQVAHHQAAQQDSVSSWAALALAAMEFLG